MKSLRVLCRIPGPTGHEKGVRDHLSRAWSRLGLETDVDRVGNLLARVGGRGPRVLLLAHMDEIGFVVRHITDDGFLLFESGQGGRRDLPDRRFSAGQRVQVLARNRVAARGDVVTTSGHLVQHPQLETPITLEDVFVDLGAKSRDEVETTGIHVGSPIVWHSPVRQRGNRVVGKALDDRLLLAVIEVLLDSLDDSRLSCELWVGASVQEENSSHGARAMASAQTFDAVVVLDITLAGDIPTVPLAEANCRLGGGPVLVHQDMSVAYDQELISRVLDTAHNQRTPVQHGLFGNYATDGTAFIDHGSPAVVLGPPVRYPHTPSEMADLSDVMTTIALLDALVTGDPLG